ncbi:MAG: glutamyl-tRNA reductase [Bacteroidia bacterium]|nr:MAG: glutamyl-tRNA reductase [Bacteroidia bacterium]
MKLYLQSSHLYVIAFSHKKLPLNLIGKLYLNAAETESYKNHLAQIQQHFSASEIMHISTCNRCEFYLVTQNNVSKEQVKTFFSSFYSSLSEEEKTRITEKVIFKKDEDAVQYLMEVASSLQSMVVGEREIITQVRNAYEHCHSLGLTGDLLRIVMKKVIETGKKVFSETDIAKNPVSVASLAARQIKQLNIPSHPKVTLIGSGVTMQTFMKYFHQENFQYTFVSRKKENSETLQKKYGGTFMGLNELKNLDNYPTNILVVCTSSPTPVIDESLYHKLFSTTQKPIIVDLSNPSDISDEVKKKFQFEYIDISSLKQQARQNLLKRKQSIKDAKQIIESQLLEFMQVFRERCVENIIREIPQELKEYKHKALNEVFRKKLEQLEPTHKELIQEIVDYLEGKFNTVTYKKLKSILLQ